MAVITLLYALSMSGPAGFRFAVEGPSVVVTVEGHEVKPGVLYLVEPGIYKVEVRFHGSDDEWVTERFELRLEPGRVKRIELRGPPPPSAVVRVIDRRIPEPSLN